MSEAKLVKNSKAPTTRAQRKRASIHLFSSQKSRQGESSSSRLAVAGDQEEGQDSGGCSCRSCRQTSQPHQMVDIDTLLQGGGHDVARFYWIAFSGFQDEDPLSSLVQGISQYYYYPFKFYNYLSPAGNSYANLVSGENETKKKEPKRYVPKKGMILYYFTHSAKFKECRLRTAIFATFFLSFSLCSFKLFQVSHFLLLCYSLLNH